MSEWRKACRNERYTMISNIRIIRFTWKCVMEALIHETQGNSAKKQKTQQSRAPRFCSSYNGYSSYWYFQLWKTDLGFLKWNTPGLWEGWAGTVLFPADCWEISEGCAAWRFVDLLRIIGKSEKFFWLCSIYMVSERRFLKPQIDYYTQSNFLS